MDLELARSLAAQLQDALRANVRLTPGGLSLQQLVVNAKGGDIIEIPRGEYVVGNVMLTPKDKQVTIIGDCIDPSLTTRITPTDTLPKLASANSGPVFNASGSKNWNIVNLDLAPRTDGMGEVVLIQDSDSITLNRVIILGGAVYGQKRGVRGNGTNIILMNSHVANCWRNGQDSQAFCAWDGAGPYVVANNYLEAGSENVLFGGSDSKSVDRIPSNILIEGNFFTKNLAWKGKTDKEVKNLLELKCAKKVIVRGNTMEHNWVDGQDGYAIVVKSENQGGTAPWSVTEDVLFDKNTLTETKGGINIQGYNKSTSITRTTRIFFTGNNMSIQGVAVQIGAGPGEIGFDGNIFNNDWTFMKLYGTPMIEKLSLTNNQWRNTGYGIIGENTAKGEASLKAFCKEYVYTGNTIVP